MEYFQNDGFSSKSAFSGEESLALLAVWTEAISCALVAREFSEWLVFAAPQAPL
jgi:hypothetical protein